MSENKTFQNWQEVIVDFFETKKEKEQEKYLKEVFKKIDTLYKDKKYCGNQDVQEYVQDFFDAKKDKKQSALDFQVQKLQKLQNKLQDNIFEFENTPDNLNIDEVQKEYKAKCDSINEKYLPKKWLSNASQNATSVVFATHVIKLTHSKIDSSSFYDNINVQMDNQLSTSALKNKAIDGAVSGNQFSPIFQFLELEFNGKKLASEFANESNQILKCFAGEENDILIGWNAGFKKSLVNRKLSSHTLAKQIYFPTDNNKNPLYHLLCNVKSSSLAHAIFKIPTTDELQRKIRDKNKYSETSINYFPNKAKLSATASNHSNASQLNGKRGGKIYLFTAQPPTWQSQLKPPLTKKSMFSYYYLSSDCKITMNYLSDFLMRFKNIDLSIKDPKRKKHLERWVNDIIDDWLFYVASIQNLPAGWSEQSKLKLEHQFLLDPYRKDNDFQTQYQTKDWQEVICNDFSNWLNKQLRNKDKKFTPKSEHSRIWTGVLEPVLREYLESIEVGFNNSIKEQV